MAKNASTPELTTTLNKHLTETNEHISDWKKYLRLPVSNLNKKKQKQ
jgi:ferritin-like metal-binding protein YciE